MNLPFQANSHLSSEVHLMLFHRSEYTKVSDHIKMNDAMDQKRQQGYA